MNPQSYLPMIKAKLPNNPIAAQEMIDILKTQKPLKPLEWSDGLVSACNDHIIDMYGSKLTHQGIDGSQPSDRMSRYGTMMGVSGENLTGGMTNAQNIIASLLVDGTVPDRGHRVNILKEKFGAVGVKAGPEGAPNNRVIVCMDYAERYKEKNGKITGYQLLLV